ncbi:MAG: hypothetical protein LIO77_11240 [Rikenellaceae bacterium]|nr:hypothetical protein [Rikenellaceae bacterium]
MAKRIIFSIVWGFLSLAAASAQDGAVLPELHYETKPFEELVAPLSTNITLLHGGISPYRTGARMFDPDDFTPSAPGPLSGWDLMRWQKDFIRDNNLHRIPADATLVDPNIMAFVMMDKSQANQEFYLNNVLMNQRRVGNTQLQRMNVRMRGVPYIDFTAFGKLVDFYIIGDPVPLASPSTMHLNNIR